MGEVACEETFAPRSNVPTKRAVFVDHSFKFWSYEQDKKAALSKGKEDRRVIPKRCPVSTLLQVLELNGSIGAPGDVSAQG